MTVVVMLCHVAIRCARISEAESAMLNLGVGFEEALIEGV